LTAQDLRRPPSGPNVLRRRRPGLRSNPHVLEGLKRSDDAAIGGTSVAHLIDRYDGLVSRARARNGMARPHRIRYDQGQARTSSLGPSPPGCGLPSLPGRRSGMRTTRLLRPLDARPAPRRRRRRWLRGGRGCALHDSSSSRSTGATRGSRAVSRGGVRRSGEPARPGGLGAHACDGHALPGPLQQILSTHARPAHLIASPRI
jgi:hypothetical protein